MFWDWPWWCSLGVQNKVKVETLYLSAASSWKQSQVEQRWTAGHWGQNSGCTHKSQNCQPVNKRLLLCECHQRSSLFLHPVTERKLSRFRTLIHYKQAFAWKTPWMLPWFASWISSIQTPSRLWSEVRDKLACVSSTSGRFLCNHILSVHLHHFKRWSSFTSEAESGQEIIRMHSLWLLLRKQLNKLPPANQCTLIYFIRFKNRSFTGLSGSTSSNRQGA